ncbi:4-hydroxyphenylpyruvate dioxygenase [Catenulispora sp. NF23]|uniref:4-hydroxyphenylpyruvate dioxygenase n=1 Tax=Catenulispora pinistramenti TaxID=2705254 RepID=A0ABS5KKC1_9ACTN|nr:4-hydroxyphenylpyruvate dioxygenase [Catenulispora pinistramenti]MBS2531154.1 4-hydroxyphenylpyruvate dioxygenase [Catenulispora pinistramenti]MBS2545916.1 4-hydroxyphenylpyruvate dioxygenase [Catenulispora pinistramenti]
MKIEGIDHVEFYVGDVFQTAFFLRTAFGFRTCGRGGPETGLAGQRSMLLGQGDIRILLTAGLSADHPAAQYVSRHGDGVAVVALETSDAALAFSEAVEAGSTAAEQPAEQFAGALVTAAVSGFGDVGYRFVTRDGSGERFLPGLTPVDATGPDPSGDTLTALDHLAVCLPSGSLTDTVDYHRDVLGFSRIFEEHIEVGGQAMNSQVVQSTSGKVTFTLIEPDTSLRPGQIDEFLQAHGGAGVQHLAFLTQDILSAVPRLRNQGVEFLETPDSYYDRLPERLGDLGLPIEALRETDVLADRDSWGHIFQIFTRSMHTRRTLFFELIDRHGAQTFGSGNIKALYEAVARK